MLSGIQQNTLMDNDPLAHGYYVADLLVALAVVVLMLRARRTRPELARMLLLGTLIGLVWELPVFGLSAWTNTPIIEWATPLPLPTVVFLLAHSVWDGPLLTMGWLLARALTGEPAGALGLTVQVLWGQLTALAVELSAILAGTWSYVDDLWFNPVMFWFRGHPVTAAMQLTWLLAPLCFAALVRRLALTPRESRRGLRQGRSGAGHERGQDLQPRARIANRCPRTPSWCGSNTPYGFRRACNST
ncbi:Conserved protein of uncharacterised function%2C leucine rich protein [Mycobacterium tuberculosis]|nr:Conserved protein of uncharacterised function%2C leucine rich protein [Mycobacterium tuberculosis]